MLQFIHRFEKTFFAFIFLFLAGISLAGLGIGTAQFGGQGENVESVASVDGHDITYSELTRARNDGQVPGQQALDGLVDRMVVRLFAERAGLAAGEGSIRQTLQEIAPGGMTAEGLSEMLRSLKMTPKELEHEIQKESVARQLYSAVSAAVLPSQRELSQGVKEFASVKTISLATASADSFVAQVVAPTDEQIESYYREQTSDFEIPAAIGYDYVVFSPEKYRDSVVVTDEDIELYYADNQREFAVPASVSAKHIRMLYPKGASTQAMAEVREKAQRAYGRAKAGESFDALVLEFSDDMTTKLASGNLGDVARGKMSPEFDAAVFKMKEPGIADLVEADYGFQIVNVTEVHPETTKPLDSVKAEIRTKLQKIEAPAYASARAGELYAEWKKAGSTLKQFAESRGLAMASTSGQLNNAQDPSVELKGATAAVFANGDEPRQQIELENSSALVEVTSRRDTEVAPLAAVKEQIVASLKLRDAGALLRAKGAELAKVAVTDFEKTAKSLGFSVNSGIEFKGQDFTPPAEVNKGTLGIQLRKLRAPGVVGPVNEGQTSYVAAVMSMKDDAAVKPEQDKMHRQIVAQQIRYDIGGLVEKALLADEKRTAKIEIKPGAYTEN